MGNQDWRHYLNGMYLNIEDKSITAVTTDAHRLAISTNTTTKSISSEVSGIIPRKSINEIGKLLSDSSEEVSLSLGANTIMLKTDSTSFVSKLIEGKFPNYEQVLPTGESSVLSVNTKQLSEILSRVSVLSSDKFKGIKLNIKSSEVLVSANNPEQEEGEESFKSNYSGDDMEIAFNVNYIQEVLSNIDSKDCNINLYGSDKSCLISPSDDPDLKYVVMPLLI
jgi:DNA polymerase-3 subunit beta